MKLALLFLLCALPLMAQTNSPVTSKVTATLSITTILRPDVSMDHPSGFEKKQYFKVVEQHVVTYRRGAELLSATNEIVSDRIVVKEMIRVGSEWFEKPK